MDEHQKRNLIPLKKALAKGGFGRTMVDANSIDAYHMTLPRIEPGTVKQAPR